MDIAIAQNKTKSRTRVLLLLVVLGTPTIFAINYLWLLGQAEYSIDRNTVVLGEVKRGAFSISVRGSGLLVPDNVQWLSASVEAKVVRLVVKPGNYVKAGDLMVELSNPKLVQQLSEAKWELAAMEAEANAAKVAQESALLEQKANTLNAKLDYESSLLENTMQTDLLEQSAGAVSKLSYQRTRLETDQYKQRWLISQERLTKMQENLNAQNEARLARVSKAENIMLRIQQQVEELNVEASMDSIVLEMPLEPGQSIVVGSNIAKLAQQDSLIAELKVPEIQIRQVAIGQRAEIDTRNSIIAGVVSRIDPSVINGNVLVDITFSQVLPTDARPDLSVDGEIKISEIAEALYVERPLFSQSKSETAFYALSDDGMFAERVKVKVGFGSVNQIQVIEGLKEGDKIITSDPTRFERYKKFRIN